MNQRAAKSGVERARKPLDRDKLRTVAETGKPDEEVRVTKRWLRKVLAELDGSRDTFRSPVIELGKARA